MPSMNHSFVNVGSVANGGISSSLLQSGSLSGAVDPLSSRQNLQNPSGLVANVGNLGVVKLEPQIVSSDPIGPLKIEKQHQQMKFIQQQRLLQIQQQQKILNNLPQPRRQVQKFIAGPSFKPVMYEPGLCSQRLTRYLYHEKHRPQDNNIEYWRKFVTEYFAPDAKMRWCVSLYGSGRQTTGVFPQDVWHCEICRRRPGRGFETTVEVIPRLCQVKYASGTLEELLYVDMPREYQNSSGQIVLEYAKAIQESVFEQLRVVRDGQLRVVFNPDFKIALWEFCARRHEELIPRRLIIPQMNHLGATMQKCQSTAQNASSNLSAQDLHGTCTSFMASGRQLAKTLEVPLVNELGYTKRYVRCLQISEVVNCMKDLIDYSRETGTGPIESLNSFPTWNSRPSGLCPDAPQSKQQPQPTSQSSFLSNPNPSLSTPSPHPENPADVKQETHIPSACSSTSRPPSHSTSYPNINDLTAPDNPNSPTNILGAKRPKKATFFQNHVSEDQSSVQKILREIMMCSRSDNNVVGGDPSMDGLRAAKGRAGIQHIAQDPASISHQNPQLQHDMGSRLLGRLPGSANGFSVPKFDWRLSQ